jgi:hypothetical protein
MQAVAGEATGLSHVLEIGLFNLSIECLKGGSGYEIDIHLAAAKSCGLTCSGLGPTFRAFSFRGCRRPSLNRPV